jgi:transposase
LGLRIKKISYGYKERRESERQAYLEQLATLDPKALIFIDESGIDDNETYPYAWGAYGQRVYGIKKANRAKRLSIISALNENNLQAPFVFEGYCNRDVIHLYIEQVLVPTLKPGQIVIMDNASFHKSKRIKEAIEKAQCQLLYLPAYSPDLNPIEHFWAAIKSSMRKILNRTDADLYEAAQFAFQNVSI